MNAKLRFEGAVVVKDESFSELRQSDVAVKRAAGIKKGGICLSDYFAALLLKLVEMWR